MIGLWGPQSLMNKNISPIDAEFANIFFKPIAHYLANPETAEVMVNAHDDIWIEDNNGLWKAPETFTQDALVSAVNSLAQYVGRPLMENVFSVDARMPDGSRVCIVLPPISGKDPIFAIRKFKEIVSDLEYMVTRNTLTLEMIDLIDSCVKIKKNMMVAGGTSSGKTTLLNLIAAKIPDNERILTIEDSRELQLKQEHVLSLEAKPADKHGKGEFTIRQCLKSTLRLRPDRIIVGEIRGGEAFDLIQAMNTGHGGCMGTVHANTPTDTLRRIESLALTADVDMPLVALRSMIASALDLVISPARLSDGSRRIVQIAEIGPLTDKGDYVTYDIVRFVSTKRDKNSGKIQGYFEFTGHIPSFFDMFEAEGVDVPLEFFRRRAVGDVPPEDVRKLLERGFEVPGQPKPEPRYINLPHDSQVHPATLAHANLSWPAPAQQPVAQQPINNPVPAQAPVLQQTSPPVAEPSFESILDEASVQSASQAPEEQTVEASTFQETQSHFVSEPVTAKEQFIESKPEFEEFSKPEKAVFEETLETPLPEPKAAVDEHAFDEYFEQPLPPNIQEEAVSTPESVPSVQEQTVRFTPPTVQEEAKPAEATPHRPSLLERLSRISGAGNAGTNPLPEPQAEAYQEPVFREELTPPPLTFEEPPSEPNTSFDEYSTAMHTEQATDDYHSPGAYSFEDEPAAAEQQQPAMPSFEPNYPSEQPQAAAIHHEVPQAEPEPAEEKTENKQHVVIAEILKRMRENRSGGS
jgi:pilus assembly protein CpaF